MNKVILTGATGLIGKDVISPLLAKNFKIYALTIEKNNSDCGINWIYCDIFDYKNVQKVFRDIKPTYLLHLAWITTGDYLTSNTNYKLVDASLVLLKEFQANGGLRAIFAGTCFEYKFTNTPIKETNELNPLSIYAQCKNELRKKAELFSKDHNISFGWGRIFYVYGNGENSQRLTANLINNLSQNKEVIINNGSLIKDYMYTKDIASAFVDFLISNVVGCVNISSGNGVSIKDYSMEFAKKLNKEKYLIIKQEPTDQPSIIIGDNTRLTKEIGYKIKYNLDIAINEILGGINAQV